MKGSPREVKARLAHVEAVIIGASAGGVTALLKLLPALPHGFPVPLVVVIHQPPTRNSSITELFQARCGMPVREAEDKESLEPGMIYFAPPDYHLLIEADRVFSLSSEEPVNFSRPAIDVLFESAAHAYGKHLLGLVLTGANEDGAEGLRSVCSQGGLGVVQTPDTAEMPTMPEAALKACPGALSLPLDKLIELLHWLFESRPQPGPE